MSQLVVHEVDSWSSNSYLLWKNITDKKHISDDTKFQNLCGGGLTLRVGFRRTILSAAGTTMRFLCGTQSEIRHQEKDQLVNPEVKMSQFIWYILS